MFVDQVKVILIAGKGGDGCVSFRREYRVPKGGPDGGRGGDGGNIYLVSDANLNTLAYFRYHPINKAKKGAHGQGSNKQGKRGRDLYLKVPVGTVVKDALTGEILHDFLKPEEIFLAARGGRGGRGNASFASSTHQTPREFEKGKPGEEKELILELKLIADVGLVGFPNVGKSTLISRISAAKPLIADYPFTTLIPNLGVVDVDEGQSFVVADIPGLIEGAHQGHGLGIQFLRHIERTRILVHLIDVSLYSGRDPVNDYRIIQNELKAFKPELVKRPQIIVANKIDLLGENRERLNALRKLARREKKPFLSISAVTGEGVRELVNLLAKRLAEEKIIKEEETAEDKKNKG
ncbi:MAG: GTPase ObgE [Candidatus Saccharicenans sp.]|nr:MAG: GTPase ObgE [Candidatus Aminicenantes bacterium]HEK86390.1 GTPase ObgE [Candidatus Aminicenantes bacterium]